MNRPACPMTIPSPTAITGTWGSGPCRGPRVQPLVHGVLEVQEVDARSGVGQRRHVLDVAARAEGAPQRGAEDDALELGGARRGRRG